MTSKVIINGHEFEVDAKDVVFILGKDIYVNYEISGSIVGNTPKVEVSGDVLNVGCFHDVVVTGNVHQNVNAQGDIVVNGGVGGSVSTQGDVEVTGNIGENVSTQGDVNVKESVGGNIVTQGDVTCGSRKNKKSSSPFGDNFPFGPNNSPFGKNFPFG